MSDVYKQHRELKIELHVCDMFRRSPNKDLTNDSRPRQLCWICRWRKSWEKICAAHAHPDSLLTTSRKNKMKLKVCLQCLLIVALLHNSVAVTPRTGICYAGKCLFRGISEMFISFGSIEFVFFVQIFSNLRWICAPKST